MASSFEKRKKGLEFTFLILFWVQLASVIISGLFKILYIANVATVDIVTIPELIISLVAVVLMYVIVRLARNGHIAAGIIGILIGVILFFSGTLWWVIGALLLMDSILYIVYYNKK